MFVLFKIKQAFQWYVAIPCFEQVNNKLITKLLTYVKIDKLKMQFLLNFKIVRCGICYISL